MRFPDEYREVEIDYTNWRGERRVRRIRPISKKLHYHQNEWHPVSQWLLEAIDLEDGARKSFAMSGIHSWKQVVQEKKSP